MVSRKRPKQAQTRLSSDEVAALVAAYRAGSTLEEVASIFSVHEQTAVAHLDRHGIPRRRHGLSAAQVAEALQLYEEGWSLGQIGERFGVWPQAIGYRLRRAGVVRRNR
jgi:DNA-directed RNA polymerase specialized sigma24 family protein